MIKKIISRWKEEWWQLRSSKLITEHLHKESRLIESFKDRLTLLESEHKRKLDAYEIERDILYSKIKGEIQKGKLLEEDVEHRNQNLKERKLELIQADNELKSQIKLLEAKAHPASVWTEAFTLGISKCWDMLLPSMQDNLDKLKQKMKDDAIQEAIARLHASNKK